jgi:hypothetical protein
MRYIVILYYHAGTATKSWVRYDLERPGSRIDCRNFLSTHLQIEYIYSAEKEIPRDEVLKALGKPGT